MKMKMKMKMKMECLRMTQGRRQPGTSGFVQASEFHRHRNSAVR